jgi:hypothetical protein
MLVSKFHDNDASNYYIVVEFPKALIIEIITTIPWD